MTLRVGDLWFYEPTGDYYQLVIKIDTDENRFYVKEALSINVEGCEVISFGYDEKEDERIYYPPKRWTKI